MNSCNENSFTYQVNGCAVSFAGLVGGSQEWDFGDGSLPTNQPNPSYTYSNSGDYIVTFTLNGTLVCQKTVRVDCGAPPACCDATFVSGLSRHCSALYLKLDAECNAGTRHWAVSTVPANQCMTLVNFNAGLGDQTVQVTNINTAVVTSLLVTHTYTCSDGSVTTAAQTVSTAGLEGIYIGEADAGASLAGDYDCVLPGAGYNGSTVVYTSGIVRIDKSFEFASADVRMHPEAGFDVAIDNVFTIRQGAHIHGNPETECNCLWRGIQVFPGAIISTGSNAILEDALYAIRAFPGSALDIRKTNFTRNFIGIRATDGFFKLAPFEENVFDGKGSGPLKEICNLANQNDIRYSDGGVCLLKPVPYSAERGFAGMYLQYLGFLDLTQLDYAKQNRFVNLALGIDAYDFNLTIRRNSRFSHIQTGGYLAGTTAYGDVAVRFTDSDDAGANNFRFVGNSKYTSNPEPDFQSCGVGVFVGSCGGISTGVQVSNTRMLDMNVGIDLWGKGAGCAITGNRNSVFRGVVENYILVNTAWTPGIWPVAGVHFLDWSAAKSNLEIYQNDIFLNLVSNINPKSSGIYVQGTDENNSTGQFQVDVNRNKVQVDAGAWGILVGLHKETWVHDNSEAAWSGAGVFVNFNDSNYYTRGIAVRFADGNLVGCNDIHLSASGLAGPRGLEIFAHPDGRIVRNYITGGAIGSNFIGDCGTATKFACNTMENNSLYGLYYQNYLNQVNTGPQGSDDPSYLTHGNQWLGSFTLGAFSNNNNVPVTSPYYVRNIITEMPSFNVGNWFNLIPSNINITPTCYYDCPIPPSQFSPVPDLTDLDRLISEDSLEFSSDLNRWWSRHNLYKKLTQYPALLANNPQMEDYMSGEVNTPMGKLAQIVSDIDNLSEVDPALKSILDSNTMAAIELVHAVETLDSLIQFSGAPQTQLTEWENQADSLLGELNTLNVISQNIAGLLTTLRQGEIPGMLDRLNAITPNHIFEEDLKAILKFYIPAVVAGIAPDSTALAPLRVIAEICPSANGPFSYWASSLYGHFTGIQLPEIDCEAEPRSSAEAIPSSELPPDITLFLSPNPTTGYLSVQANGLADARQAVFTVMNVMGEIVLQQHAYDGSNHIDLHGLPNGVYLLQLSATGARSIHRLFVIVY